MTSRMFEFITKTWNPIGGRCPHDCIYCWSMGKDGLVNRYKMKKYRGEPYRDYRSKENFKEGDFVFVCDMTDLFASNVSNMIILQVLGIIKCYSKTKFLLLTKNPQRYLEFIDDFPSNVVLGATIESNWDYPEVSKAPLQNVRIMWMWKLSSKTKLPLFISIESILTFDFRFPELIKQIKNLWGIAIGYDNYNNKLEEPTLFNTQKLIRILEGYKIKVFKKTIRKAWNEK